MQNNVAFHLRLYHINTWC